MGRKMPLPLSITPFLEQARGVFVTLYKHGQLRGCMGDIMGSKPLYALIPEVAIKSAFEDPRFAPLDCSELDDLTVSVSVLSSPRRIARYQDIEIGKHGVILQQGSKSAVFLPKVPVEQKWDLQMTLSHLARKAQLPSNAWKDPKTRFFVFESIDF